MAPAQFTAVTTTAGRGGILAMVEHVGPSDLPRPWLAIGDVFRALLLRWWLILLIAGGADA